MATDRLQERIVAGDYPSAMRHLQKLILDSEACSKSYGKKGIFGGDKFEPAFEKFMTTLATCIKALSADGHITDIDDTEDAVDRLHFAMKRLEQVYGSWPLGFQFWHSWYVQFKAKAVQERGA